MMENLTTGSSANANFASVKRYAPPNQRNQSLGRRTSGGDRLERANSCVNDGEKNQINASWNIPITDHGDAGGSNHMIENSRSRLISIRGCFSSEAFHLLNNPSAIVPSFVGTPTISTTKLSGRNYSSWAVGVELWFIGQGLEDHLTEAPSTNLSESDACMWRRVDAQLVSLLWQSIEPSLQNAFRMCRTCQSFWTAAKDMFYNEVTRIYDVISDMIRVQSADNGLMEYYSQFQNAVLEFNDLFPISTDPRTILAQREKFFVILWLRGLSSEYEVVRSQILASPTLPTLSEAYSRLSRASPHHGPFETLPICSALVTHSGGRADAHTRRGFGRGRGDNGKGGSCSGNGQRPRCSYCNKLGHVRDTCWTLHGRPLRVANAT